MILLWLACAPPPIDSTGGEPTLPHHDNPTAQADWDHDALQAAIDEVVRVGPPRALALHDAYLDLHAQGDERCPGPDLFITDSQLYGCTSDSGMWYAGITDYYDDWFDRDGVTSHFRILIGDIEIHDTQGQVFQLGGHVLEEHQWGSDGAPVGLRGQLKGAMRWQGDLRWYFQRVSALFDYRVLPDELVLDGAVSFLGNSLNFQRFKLLPGECGYSATGTYEIRDPVGAWHTITLGAENACSGCGPVSFAGGPPEGEVCLNLEALASPYFALLEANQ